MPNSVAAINCDVMLNKYVFDHYASDYLICQAENPLLSASSLREEIILYNLDEASQSNLINEFNLITGKDISLKFDISLLSGGQKVILMVLLALYSPAKKILFHNVFSPLDEPTREAVQVLIGKFQPEKQEILLKT